MSDKELIKQDDIEEPETEDLEEEINRVDDWYPVELKYIQAIAHHFAEWQKQKDKQLIGATQKISFQHGYDEGRFDMREEMLKDACDTKITTDKNSIFPIIKYQLPLTYDCKIGDKVKIIIIKPEQQ